MDNSPRLMPAKKSESIFICSAPTDSAQIASDLKSLASAGFNIYFDSRTNAEKTASEIIGCDLFVYYLSSQFLGSPDYLNELIFALNNKKRCVAIYLEDVNFSPGLALRTASHPIIKRWSLPSDAYQAQLTDILDANLPVSSREIPKKIAPPPSIPSQDPAKISPVAVTPPGDNRYNLQRKIGIIASVIGTVGFFTPYNYHIFYTRETGSVGTYAWSDSFAILSGPAMLVTPLILAGLGFAFWGSRSKNLSRGALIPVSILALSPSFLAFLTLFMMIAELFASEVKYPDYPGPLVYMISFSGLLFIIAILVIPFATYLNGKTVDPENKGNFGKSILLLLNGWKFWTALVGLMCLLCLIVSKLEPNFKPLFDRDLYLKLQKEDSDACLKLLQQYAQRSRD